ncbi:MAG: hypothetical protein IJ730_01110 [Alphaproteobacteria bacterium]|nr:hypothetical protein [Alphaproteobacteria bacterium]
MRYILLLMSFLLSNSLVAMNFMEIVKENSRNPYKIVTEMKQCCNDKNELEDIASAFLDNFGGDNFQERAKFECKNYSQEIREQLREAALLIGKDMRKLGKEGVDETSLQNLTIAKRFLEFADYNGSHHFFDEDISNSFVMNELVSMIDERTRYLNSINHLKESMKTMKVDNSDDDILSCLSDDDNN